MKFCSKCDNMYYIGISVDDANQLIYYCRNCRHKDETITEECEVKITLIRKK